MSPLTEKEKELCRQALEEWEFVRQFVEWSKTRRNLYPIVREIPRDDLEALCQLALVQAVAGFDPSRTTKVQGWLRCRFFERAVWQLKLTSRDRMRRIKTSNVLHTTDAEDRPSEMQQEAERKEAAEDTGAVIDLLLEMSKNRLTVWQRRCILFLLGRGEHPKDQYGENLASMQNIREAYRQAVKTLAAVAKERGIEWNC